MQPSSISATLGLLLLLANCGSQAQQQPFPGPVDSSGPRLPYRPNDDRYEDRERDQDQGFRDYGREQQTYRDPSRDYERDYGRNKDRDNEREDLLGQQFGNYRHPYRPIDNIIIKEA